MRCVSCETELSTPPEAFTGDVCPECQHFAHPTRLGLYENLELIKRGGMGSVYRARHPKLGTTVAIKAVHAHTGPATLAQRFEREAGLAARIPHPGVVRVFDYDCQEGRLYLVMEHVDGTTLRQQIQEGRRDLAWCLDKVAQLCDVLQAAHDQGIVHRDIKPENVMVESTGKVRVLDFGISRVIADDDRLTQPGEILGTPEYISPEQILDVADAVDARTDVYATGVVLYEMLTGTSPFAGNNLFQVLKYVEARVPPPPSKLVPGLPPALDALVMEAIAKDKEQRPASAALVARRLRDIARVTGQQAVGRQGWPAAARLVVGLCVLLAAWASYATWSWLEVVVENSESTGAAKVVLPLPAHLRLERAAGDPVELRALAAQIPDDAPPADIHVRARAHFATGALFLAWRDFERVRLLNPEATRQARVAWVMVHKLVPALLGQPRWLLTGIEPPAGDPDDDAIAALMRNEFRLAVERLQLVSVPGGDDQLLLGLALYLAGDPAAKVALRAGATESLPRRMLAAVVEPGQAVAALREVAADLDRLSPMRYFVAAAIAMRSKDLPRLRAASELALVAGESEFATAVYLAGRIVLAAPSGRASEFQRLRPMADGLSVAVAPGLLVARIMLALGAGDDPGVGRLLDELPDTGDPCLAWFRAWRAARAADLKQSQAFYQALDASHHRGGDAAARRLQAWLDGTAAQSGDEVDLARRYLALTALGAGAGTGASVAGFRAALLTAVQKGSDLGTFRREVESAPYQPGRPDQLVATLRRGAESAVDAGDLVGLLRLLHAWGGDLQALRGDAAFVRLRAAIDAALPRGRDG